MRPRTPKSPAARRANFPPASICQPFTTSEWLEKFVTMTKWGLGDRPFATVVSVRHEHPDSFTTFVVPPTTPTVTRSVWPREYADILSVVVRAIVSVADPPGPRATPNPPADQALV
jgi:hypothetical protein